jgi:hypothetical protein
MGVNEAARPRRHEREKEARSFREARERKTETAAGKQREKEAREGGRD